MSVQAPGYLGDARDLDLARGSTQDWRPVLPPLLLWRMALLDGGGGDPLVCDVDGDGLPDLILAQQRRVSAFSGWGERIWEQETLDGLVTPALADLDGDGALELVAGSACRRVFVLQAATGLPVWVRVIDAGGDGGVHVTVADLDGDGLADVAAAGETGSVYGLRGATGDELWRRDFRGYCNVAGGDLLGDRAAELVVQEPGGVLAVLDGRNGETVWDLPPESTRPGSPPRLADLDGDGRLEILAELSPERTSCLDGATGLARWEAEGRPAGEQEMVKADLDGDGNLDVLVSAHKDRRLAGLDGRSGSVLWARTWKSQHIARGAADLDGDGAQELIVTSGEGLACLDGRTGEPRWGYGVTTANSTCALADLDGDGSLELVAQRAGGEIIVLSGRPAAAWVREASMNVGAVAWPGPAAGAVWAENPGDGAIHAYALADGRDLGPVTSIRHPLKGLFVPADLDGDGRPGLVYLDEGDLLRAEDRSAGGPGIEWTSPEWPASSIVFGTSAAR